MGEDNNIANNPFANNILWKMADLISRKVFGFAISILLARLLLPEAYGVIALTTVFIAFTNIFILNGFNVALIRKEKTEAIEYSTVMVMSLCLVILINIVIYFAAPIIARFYETKELCAVLRAMMFGLFFSAVTSVVSAKATRELKFKQMAIPSFCSNAIGGVAAVIIAYLGGGVWALVFQHLLASIILMIWYIALFEFPLSFKFSVKVVKETYKFTIGVISTSFLEFLGNHVCSLVIGKAYSSKGLGYYDRSNGIPEMISVNIAGSIANVLLPTLSKIQNAEGELKRLIRKTMSLVLFIILPIMFGIIGCAKIFVQVLLTDKWTPMIPLLYIACLFYTIAPIRVIEYSLLYSLGRSDIAAKVEIVRAVMMIVGVIFISLIFKLSIIFVAIANLLICFIVALWVHHYVRRLIGYGFQELFCDSISSFIIASIVMLFLLFISYNFDASWLTLLSQIMIGGSLYFLIAYITRNKNFTYFIKYRK